MVTSIMIFKLQSSQKGFKTFNDEINSQKKNVRGHPNLMVLVIISHHLYNHA